MLKDIAFTDSVLQMIILNQVLFAQNFHSEDTRWITFKNHFVDFPKATFPQNILNFK